MPLVRARGAIALLGGALLIEARGCDSSSGGDSSPSELTFDDTLSIGSPPQAAIILVVDDRSNASAAELRAGIGAAMWQLGSDAVKGATGIAPDWAAWHPIDVAVVIVPASAASIDAAISPAVDPRLAWRTNQATPKGADDLAIAVEQHVRDFAAPEGVSFQPLARTRDVVDLLTRVRAPASDSEAGLFEAVSPESQRIGVAIVAATDDESPRPVTSYLLPLDGASAGLATSQRDPLGQIDRAAYPRLVEWANGIIGSPFYDCSGDSQPPFWLFPPLCRNHWGGRHCPGYSVAESAPGVGRCSIQITTLEPVECEASRGWIDPLDDEGARRPRMTDTGGRVCDMMLVDPSVMDACIHDETCPDCGSGWCVSDVLPLAKYCPAGTSPLPLRWVGGALPSPGLVHISCLKRAEPAGP